MEENKGLLLEAIKEAMKGELTSITNYKTAAESSDDEEVKTFFNERMEEEKRHYNYLLEYYQFMDKEKNLSDEVKNLEAVPEHEQVFTPQFIERIGENQILFSAISVAILLEKNAMEFYQTHAEKTSVPDLKKFYKLMAKWETIHYEDVLEISKQAERKYWQINQFEPF